MCWTQREGALLLKAYHAEQTQIQNMTMMIMTTMTMTNDDDDDADYEDGKRW